MVLPCNPGSSIQGLSLARIGSLSLAVGPDAPPIAPPRAREEQREAVAEVDTRYAVEIAGETSRLQAPIGAAKKRRSTDSRRAAQKALRGYQMAIADKKAAECRVRLKSRSDYPIFCWNKPCSAGFDTKRKWCES